MLNRFHRVRIPLHQLVQPPPPNCQICSTAYCGSYKGKEREKVSSRRLCISACEVTYSTLENIQVPASHTNHSNRSIDWSKVSTIIHRVLQRKLTDLLLSNSPLLQQFLTLLRFLLNIVPTPPPLHLRFHNANLHQKPPLRLRISFPIQLLALRFPLSFVPLHTTSRPSLAPPSIAYSTGSQIRMQSLRLSCARSSRLSRRRRVGN